MNKTGLAVLGASIGAAFLLFIIWLIGLLTNIAGNLIHVALLLALAVGFFGTVIGLVLIVIGRKSS